MLTTHDQPEGSNFAVEKEEEPVGPLTTALKQEQRLS